MANKYSRYELKPYVSQYVDPGWTEATQVLRDRWDANKEKHSKLQQLAAATKVGEGDKHHKTAAIQNIANQFDDTITTNSFENADTVITDAAFDFMNNDALKVSAQSYEWWTKEQEMKLEARAKGKNILFDKVTLKNEDGTIKRDENDNPIWVNKFDQHSSYYQDPETGQTHVNVYSPEFQEQLPYDEKMTEIVKNIQSDPILLQKYNVTANDVKGFLTHGNEINPDKIEAVTRMLHDTYLSTDHGIQQIRYLTQEALHPESGEHYTPEEAQQEVLNQMTAIAMKQQTAELDYLHDRNFSNDIKNTKTTQNIKGTANKQGWKYNTDAYTLLDLFDSNGWDNKVQTYTEFDAEGYQEALNSLPFWDKNVAADLRQSFTKTVPIGNFDQKGNWIFPDDVTKMDIMNDEGENSIENTLKKYIDQYNAFLKSAGGEDQDLLNEKFLRANADLYVAHLIANNKDAYIEMKKEGKSDKDFLRVVSESMESIKNEQKYIKSVSQPFSDEIAKRVQRGEFKYSSWYYNNDKNTGMEDVIDQMAHDYKKQGTKGGSGVSENKTKVLIKNAMADPKNISVSGFAPSGNFAGSYVMQLNVPAAEDGSSEGFTVSFEIASADEISDQFSRSHEIVNSLSKGNFSGVQNITWGIDKDGNQEIADVSWQYSTETGKMEPVASITTYKPGDLQMVNGILEPKEDAQVVNERILEGISPVTGKHWLQTLQDLEYAMVEKMPFYQTMFQGMNTKGVIEPN